MILYAALLYGMFWASSGITWLTALLLLLCAVVMTVSARRHSRQLRCSVYALLGLGEAALWIAYFYYRSLPPEPELLFEGVETFVSGANALLLLAVLPLFLAAGYGQRVRELTAQEGTISETEQHRNIKKKDTAPESGAAEKG